jgi:hypothetical protein
MKLSEPTPELAVRLTTDVNSDQRLTAYRYRPRWGGLPAHLYSFEEVARLLNDRTPRINLAKLEQWLRTAVQDAELAAAVADIRQTHETDREQLLAISKLFNERLSQCKRYIAETTHGP